eukprot:TRINITY_DN2345_c0_g1_i1.p1 TRINITY_DN2345_c0_g1~~TRINITY_DN2345_c0_g1_i1.p1  ORF type:complete len:385 (+),score=87.47 TRINITY_DN2345_c0_g1_i1:2587-3741(+)
MSVPLGLLGDVGSGAVVLNGYLSKPKSVFPYVNQLDESSPPLFAGTQDDFLKTVDEDFAKRAKNKVRKCPTCSKVVAFTLANCNGCGTNITKVDISYTNNIFVGFTYGIQKGPFPFTISVRYQSPEYLAFDDLLSLCPCHLNIIPSTQYLPDWRFLLKNPAQGKQLIERLFETAWKAVEDNFLSNVEWKKKILKGDLTNEQLRNCIISGFNYPPSQYQLHLQFMLPPFVPHHYHQYLQGLHFTPGRFFPYEYVLSVLSLNIPPSFPIDIDTPIESIIQFYDKFGVVYDDIHRKFYAKYGELHQKLSNWKVEDFEGMVVGGKFWKFAGDEKSGPVLELQEGQDIAALVANDKLVLQNYGRPYVDAKPSGTYYKYAKTTKDTINIW